MPALAVDVLTLVALVALGAAWVAAILGWGQPVRTTALGLGVGIGVLTWCLFLISWAGVPLTAAVVIVVYSCLLLAGILAALWARSVARRRAGEERIGNAGANRSEDHVRRSTWIVRGSWAVIIVLFVVASVLSVGLSYYSWDEIANWGVKGHGIALEHSILGGLRWGDVGLSYPPNIPLIIAVYGLMDGDALPGAKLLFPALYLSLLVGVYEFWKGHGVSAATASIGALFLATTPILFSHATIAYANLTFSLYLVMGLTMSIEGMRPGGTRAAWLGGVLLALAAWTRPEGLLMVGAVFVALVLSRVLVRGQTLRLLPAVVPVLVIVLPWISFQRAFPSEPTAAYEFGGLALSGIASGRIEWSALLTVLRFIAGLTVRFRDWGYILLVAGVMCVAALRWKEFGKDATRAALWFALATLGLVVVGAHYMAAYASRGPDWTYVWLSLNFARVVMPVGVILVMQAFLSHPKLV